MSYIGVDIGSSQVKAAAFAGNGECLYTAYRKYEYQIPEANAMELDSDEVCAGAFECIRECAEAVRKISPVRGIACSSQGEAFTCLDRDGKALCNAMISGDSRATENIAEFTEKFGREKLYRITGHTPSGMFSLGKILWIKENKPEVFAETAHIFCFEDLLAYRLTGMGYIGYPLAGRTMMFDVVRHEWSDEICEAVGVKSSMFAEALPSGTAAAKISAAAAAELSLDEDVFFVTGGHDQIIGAYGCGAHEPGMAMYAAGSVECAVPILGRAEFTGELMESNLCTYDSAVKDCYASVGYSLTGSNLVEYFMREIVRDEARDYGKLLDAMPDEVTDLYVLPYFTPSGTPYFDAETPGCVYGWRFGTTRETLLKGLLEGVALEMRLNFDFFKRSNLMINKLIATGGGFRNRKVVQLHADVLNLPIYLCEEKEAGCRGAAMLVQRALEERVTIPAPEITGVVYPDAVHASEYEKKFNKWKDFSANIRNMKLWQS